MKRKLKGFTLVELVITIAIVIILSVVSVPIYRGYVNKAKMAEGYALLGTILSAQKAYYSQYGSFLRDTQASTKGGKYYTTNEEVLGIDARGNKYFTLFSIGFSGASEILYGYRAFVIIPPELRERDEPGLGLYYNLTTGAKFVYGTEHYSEGDEE